MSGGGGEYLRALTFMWWIENKKSSKLLLCLSFKLSNIMQHGREASKTQS